MRKNLVLFCFLVLGFSFFVIGVTSLKGNSSTGTKLEQYIEIELKRIDETYRLLDHFAEKIWPGWDNYNEVEVRVRFPNMVHLLVNPRKDVPKGYEQVQGRTLRGKAIFINREKELPIKLKLPLIGGGGGGLTIRLKLRQTETLPKNFDQYFRATDDQILVYVHEFFHGFQHKNGPIGKGDEPLYKFKVDTHFATYANIEGLALLEAFNEKDDTKALESLKDYLVAREIKQKSMSPEVIASEQGAAVAEGTASYANVKMAMLVKDSQYKPGLSQQDDPFFFNYKFMDEYIKTNLEEDLRLTMEMTLDKVGKCYAFGAYQCFVLDRFVPGWKQGFFQGKKTMDQVITDFLKLSPQQKKEIALRLKSKYPYDELYAKHNAVITERDDALEMIKNRKGKKYIVDFQAIREFPEVIPRGKAIRIDVQQIFLRGIEKLTLGEIELTSVDTPMHRPWLFTFEWIDTEGEKEKKGYELSFKEKGEDTYKNVVLKTKGFTFKAPEVQIKEDNEKDEVRIVILSKVAR